MGASTPVELWADQSGDMHARALWVPETQEFEVVVSQGERLLRERFRPLYVPRFGIDAADLMRIHEIAERLAQRLERGEGDPVTS